MDLRELGVLLGMADLATRVRAVEARIDSVLGTDDDVYRDAMRRVTGSGGKRLRPALTIACAELHGTWDERIVEVAAAAELVQIGSLVHDDIIDAAATRRGTPTVNAVEGPDAALVAGDLLLARAGELASGVSGDAGRLVAATISRLCLGQFMEMTDSNDTARTVERHLRSIEGKTAALFECSCRLGAMCAGADEVSVDALGRFGNAFGMAFQMLDDVLDLVGDADRLGKPVAVDIAAGVYTLPVLHTLAGPDAEVLRTLLPTDAAAAQDLVVGAGGVEAATKVMHEYAADATAALDGLQASNAAATLDGLRSFPRSYLDRALEEFVATDA